MGKDRTLQAIKEATQDIKNRKTHKARLEAATAAYEQAIKEVIEQLKGK